MKQDIINLTNEWNEKNGTISAEFSFHKDLLPEFEEYTSKMNVKGGKWVSRECSTCQKHHGKDYLHAEIISQSQIKQKITPPRVIDYGTHKTIFDKNNPKHVRKFEKFHDLKPGEYELK